MLVTALSSTSNPSHGPSLPSRFPDASEEKGLFVERGKHKPLSLCDVVLHVSRRRDFILYLTDILPRKGPFFIFHNKSIQQFIFFVGIPGKKVSWSSALIILEQGHLFRPTRHFSPPRFTPQGVRLVDVQPQFVLWCTVSVEAPFKPWHLGT